MMIVKGEQPGISEKIKIVLKKRNPGFLTLVDKYLKYKKDVVKFVEDCVHIKKPEEKESKKFKLDYVQKKILRSFIKDHYLCLLNTRQVGTSTTLKALTAYILTCHENCTIAVITNGRFVIDVQEMLDRLPQWLSPRYVYRTSNKIILENGCCLFSVSKPNSNCIFCGMSICILIVEDAVFINNLNDIFECLNPVLATVHKAAKNEGIPYGIILSSIPGICEKSHYFRRLWEEIINSDRHLFKPIKVYWKRITRFREDPNWYTNVCNMLCNDKRKIDRELNLKFL